MLASAEMFLRCAKYLTLTFQHPLVGANLEKGRLYFVFASVVERISTSAEDATARKT
jgi:hypothetical protein